MKKSKVYALLFLFSHYCNGATSSFTVEGKVTAATCAVVSKEQRVKLPIAPSTSLRNASDTTGRTPFSIEIKGCPPDSFIYFEGDPLASIVVGTSGRLPNTAVKGAQNVQLQILNSDGSAVDVNAAKGQQVSSAGVAVGGADENRVKFDFFVQYYATGAAVAGKVTGTVTFLVESI